MSAWYDLTVEKTFWELKDQLNNKGGINKRKLFTERNIQK
jgi:hypothetical protein